MKQILIYDDTNEVIEKLVEKTDTTEAEVVQALLDAIADNGIDIENYL